MNMSRIRQIFVQQQAWILIPADILVLVFMGAGMMPKWTMAALALVNIGVWWCYFRIPHFLRRVSGVGAQGILIPGPIIEYFARFINSCGVHHRVHYGLMLSMMAGGHIAMMPHSDPGFHPILGIDPVIFKWVAYAALLGVDAWMLAVSWKTLQELKRDKVSNGQEYTEELLRSNEELEQFAYIASHDLRTPLRGVINLAEWMRDDVSKNCSAETGKHLDLIEGRVRRMDMMLQDLLQYARIGRQETTKEHIVMGDLTRSVFDSLNIDGAHRLTLEGERTSVTDYAITHELILSNLIANAIKHGEKPSVSIKVSFKAQHGLMKLSVEDDGPGIPEQYREQVFDVFKTLHPRDQREASGMGLSIVQKIVSHRQGSVHIGESEQGGARFDIVLPIEDNT